MSDKAFLVTSIFKVINFAVFIPNLEQERRGLQNQEANIETAIAQQALVAKVLQKKIEGWAAAHKNQLQEHEENNLHLQRLLEQKIKQQEDYRAQRTAYQEAIPEIIADTKKSLEQKYQDPESARAYIDTLFQHLKDNA